MMQELPSLIHDQFGLLPVAHFHYEQALVALSLHDFNTARTELDMSLMHSRLFGGGSQITGSLVAGAIAVAAGDPATARQHYYTALAQLHEHRLYPPLFLIV